MKKKKRTKPERFKQYTVGRHEGAGVYDLEGCEFHTMLSGAIADLIVRSAQLEDNQDVDFHLQLLLVETDHDGSVYDYKPVPCGMFVQWLFEAGHFRRGAYTK